MCSNAKLLNGLTLAYLGDSIYELHIRKHFVEQGFQKVDDLHKLVVKYTCAEHQSKVMKELIENNILTKEEDMYFKRGRNSHVNKTRKTLSKQDYLLATGFESLMGFLYLNKEEKRIEELVMHALSLREE